MPTTRCFGYNQGNTPECDQSDRAIPSGNLFQTDGHVEDEGQHHDISAPGWLPAAMARLQVMQPSSGTGRIAWHPHSHITSRSLHNMLAYRLMDYTDICGESNCQCLQV